MYVPRKKHNQVVFQKYFTNEPVQIFSRDATQKNFMTRKLSAWEQRIRIERGHTIQVTSPKYSFGVLISTL